MCARWVIDLRLKESVSSFQNLADAVRPASGGASAHVSAASTPAPGATGGVGGDGGGGGKSQNGDVDYKKVSETVYRVGYLNIGS